MKNIFFLLIILSNNVFCDERTEALTVRFNKLSDKLFVYREVMSPKPYNAETAVSNIERHFKTIFLTNPDHALIEAKMVEMEIMDLQLKQDEAAQAVEAASRIEEINQIKAAISLIDSSDKPAWEKKLLKRLIKELR